MFSKSIQKAVRPYLHDSEQLLAAVLAQSAGANAAMMASAVRGPVGSARAHAAAYRAQEHAGDAARAVGLGVDRSMVIAVTTRRLLILKAGGAFTVKAKELLGEVPITDVEAIDVVPDGRLTQHVTLHVRGAAIGVEAARAQPAEDLPRALERARAVR